MLNPLRTTLIFFLFFSSYLSANEEINALKKQLKNTKDELARMTIINDLATAYYEVNIDSIEKYARISLNYGLNHKSPLIYSNGLHQLGVAAEKKGDIEVAINYFIKGLNIRDSLKINSKIASSNLSLGNIHIGIGADYESQNLDDVAQQKFLKAKEFYQRALQYALLSHDSLTVHHSYTNLAFAHDRLYEYKQAIKNYELSIPWIPHAKAEEKQSLVRLQILSAKSDSGILNKADLELEYDLLTKNFEKRNEIENLIYCNGNFAAMVWDIDLDLAEKYLLTGDSLAEEYGDLKCLSKSKQTLFELKKERGNYKKALEYYELHSKYSNQIRNSDSKSKFDELLIKYETEKTEKELIEETSNKNKWRLALFFSLLILAGLVIFFMQRQRINRLKRKEEKDRYNQAVNDLIQNQELASVEAMLQGQDTERQRIAEDLHDRLGSTLSAAKMYFEVDNLKQSGEKSNKAFELLDKAIDETRDIAHNLVSGILSKFGLKAALNDLKETIEGTGKVKIDIVFNHHFDRLSSEIEIQLYRIVQEVFSNALKHSKASLLSVELNQNMDQFTLLVSDNGQGFEKDKVSYGMGIRNINARVSKLNGKVEIDTSKAGTFFTINFNILNNES